LKLLSEGLATRFQVVGKNYLLIKTFQGLVDLVSHVDVIEER
jgi:hypothetical protein